MGSLSMCQPPAGTNGNGRNAVVAAAEATVVAAVPERPDTFRELLAMMRVPAGVVSSELVLLGAACEAWQFDSFQLSGVLGGRPLSALGFFLFKRSNLVDKV